MAAAPVEKRFTKVVEPHQAHVKAKVTCDIQSDGDMQGAHEPIVASILKPGGQPQRDNSEGVQASSVGDGESVPLVKYDIFSEQT